MHFGQKSQIEMSSESAFSSALKRQQNDCKWTFLRKRFKVSPYKKTLIQNQMQGRLQKCSCIILSFVKNDMLHEKERYANAIY